jgi:hypothetical protein
MFYRLWRWHPVNTSIPVLFATACEKKKAASVCAQSCKCLHRRILNVKPRDGADRMLAWDEKILGKSITESDETSLSYRKPMMTSARPSPAKVRARVAAIARRRDSVTPRSSTSRRNHDAPNIRGYAPTTDDVKQPESNSGGATVLTLPRQLPR